MSSDMQGPGRPESSDVSLADATSASGESGRAHALISALKLTYLPKESGYIGILGRSSKLVKTIPAGQGKRRLAAQSHNFYMLTSDLPINYLHWLDSDDTHVLVEGGPVDYFVFHPAKPGEEAKAVKVTLGMDLDAGQHPAVAVPGGCWKALKLGDGVSHALTVNVLSPEFTEDRVRIGEGGSWIAQFAGKAVWATEEFLTGLIGPNLWGG